MTDLVTELQNQEYAGLSPLQAFNLLRSKSAVTYGSVNSGTLRGYLAANGKLSALIDAAATPDHPLRDAAKAVEMTLTPNGEFDFSNSMNIALLDAFVTGGILTATDKTAILALAEQQTAMFPNVTLKSVVEILAPELIEASSAGIQLSGIRCARGQGIFASVTLDEAPPGTTSLELHIEQSLDGVTYAIKKYVGSLSVSLAGVHSVNIAPQATGPYNRLSLVSREFVLSISDFSAIAY